MKRPGKEQTERVKRREGMEGLIEGEEERNGREAGETESWLEGEQSGN